MKIKIRKQGEHLFFRSAAIATEIHQAILRDLSPRAHVYSGLQDGQRLYSERQRKELTKKFVTPGSDAEDLALITFIKFVMVNNHMADFTGKSLDLPSKSITRPCGDYDFRTNVLIRARNLMHSVLSPFTEDEWFQYSKHGTGTSLGVSYNDTSLEAKFTFPVTMTKRVKPLFDRYLEFDSMLNSALVEHNRATPIGEWYRIVEGSRATTVEKSDKVRRMIAIEPTGNMFFQQGLMDMMYRRMKTFRLDVERLPSIHRERARLSSITSNEATIDWSSASDCMSIDLLRWFLPPQWFDCLDQVRSPAILLQDELLELNMFSTMGNAGTFPLETLVFWTIAQATRLTLEATYASSYPFWEDMLKCSVFGDDCIVPSHVAVPFMEIMQSVGFIVNKEKSFFGDERFRESCGGDFLSGYNVRPFHLKAPTSERLSYLEPWLYIVLNSLVPKYISYFGRTNYIYDKEIFKLVFSLFHQLQKPIRLVPDDFPDDAGLKWSFDLERLVLCYPMRLTRIGVNYHGTYTFQYLQFKYAKRGAHVDHLRYVVWLKNKSHGKRVPWWPIRKKGGYVVAKGSSCHWHVPQLGSYPL